MTAPTSSNPGQGHPSRRHERHDAVISVSVNSEHNFWTGLTQNISKGGLFLATDRVSPTGTRLSFSFQLAPDPKVYQVEGIVRWVRSPDLATDDLPAGMGVQVENMPDALLQQIDKFISSQRESLLFDDEDDLG